MRGRTPQPAAARLEMRAETALGLETVTPSRPTKTKTERARLIRFAMDLLRAKGCTAFDARTVPTARADAEWGGDFYSIKDLARNVEPGETFTLFGYSKTGWGADYDKTLEASIEITF